MKMEIDIPDDYIIDVITTALEGGSNYWYYLPHTDHARKWFPDSNQPLSQMIIKAVLQHDEKFIVYDLETKECIGSLTQNNIKRGILFYINHMIEMEDRFTFDLAMDAGEADMLFQFIVLGELVYA